MTKGESAIALTISVHYTYTSAHNGRHGLSCRIWKYRKVLKEHEASVNTIAISPDGQTLATGSQDRTVSLWNLKTGK